jgi:hypothetical protein
LFALASIYGIELLEDNHEDAKESTLAEFLRFHDKHGVPCGAATPLRKAAAFLIESGVAVTQTFLTIGAFDTEAEARACLS